MVKQQIFADYNATTPVAPEVFEAMRPYLQSDFGNPSSWHQRGQRAKVAVEQAREQVAQLLGCSPSHIRFTGGATEANNWVIKGYTPESPPHHILSSAIEHPSVIECGRFLEQRGWAEFSKCGVDAQGLCSPQAVLEGLRPNTQMVCVMLANNENGVVQDVAALAYSARFAGAWFHTDAVQALGKLPLDFRTFNEAGVHALTVSAHKAYGPKGAAALVVDKRVELQPLIAGGGHERGLRSGTENVPAIVGFGVACELAATRLVELPQRLTALREKLEQGLVQLGATIFSLTAERLSNTSYFAFSGLDGETLVGKLDRAGYAVASGAACSSANPEPSHVLAAMGVAPELARGAVRVSLGAGNTETDIEQFINTLQTTVGSLRGLTAVAV